MTIEEALAFVDSERTAGGDSTKTALKALASEVRRLRAKEYSPMAEPGSDHLRDRKYRAVDKTWWRRNGNQWIESIPPTGWMETNSKAGKMTPAVTTPEVPSS